MGRLVARVTAAVALTAGCSTAPAAGPAQPPDTPGSTTQGATPSPAASPPRVVAPRQFPLPRQLGAGWSYRVDPGDPEAGYDGSGTPVLRRDPAEVTALAVPLGCPRPTLPTARKATEVDYSYRSRPVVAIRLVFDHTSQAKQFVERRQSALRGCVGLTGGPAVGPYVAHVGELTNERTPASEPWTELVVRREAAVLLVAAAGRIEDSPLDPAPWRRVRAG